MNKLLDKRLSEIDAAIALMNSQTYHGLETIIAAYDGKVTQELEVSDFQELCKSLTERCLTCVALMHPVAYDLLFTMTAVRIGHDYEKMFDLMINLYERAGKLQPIRDHEAIVCIRNTADVALTYHAVLSHCHGNLPAEDWSMIEKAANEAAELAKVRIAHTSALVFAAMNSQDISPELKVEMVLASRHASRIINLMNDIMEEWRHARHA